MAMYINIILGLNHTSNAINQPFQHMVMNTIQDKYITCADDIVFFLYYDSLEHFKHKKDLTL